MNPRAYSRDEIAIDVSDIEPTGFTAIDLIMHESLVGYRGFDNMAKRGWGGLTNRV